MTLNLFVVNLIKVGHPCLSEMFYWGATQNAQFVFMWLEKQQKLSRDIPEKHSRQLRKADWNTDGKWFQISNPLFPQSHNEEESTCALAVLLPLLKWPSKKTRTKASGCINLRFHTPINVLLTGISNQINIMLRYSILNIIFMKAIELGLHVCVCGYLHTFYAENWTRLKHLTNLSN